MRICTYCRVSTKDRGQDTENQARDLRNFAAAQGWEIVAEYVDHISGKSGDRPQFKRMFEDARKGNYDLVLFWSLDRFSREGVLATLRYLEQLTAAGIGWRSYTEQYLDSCGIFKDAVLAILAVVAKQERIRLSERVTAGMARAKAQGTRVGRPKVVIDRAKLREMLESGMSTREAGKELGISKTLAWREGRGKS